MNWEAFGLVNGGPYIYSSSLLKRKTALHFSLHTFVVIVDDWVGAHIEE
jgi:hypothetical protein